MTTITIDEVVNGYIVRIHNFKEGYLVNEFVEREIEAIGLVLKFATDKATDIKEKLQCY